MKADRFRLFRRRKVFYAQDSITGKQESLRTKDRKTVERWLLAKNEAHAHPVINLGVARAHLLAHDPRMNERTWSTRARHGLDRMEAKFNSLDTLVQVECAWCNKIMPGKTPPSHSICIERSGFDLEQDRLDHHAFA
jgi:hypothetical protein